jgi:hypothetical protein
MTMTTEELMQLQYEARRQQEMEMFKRWMATATCEVWSDRSSQEPVPLVLH